MSRSIFTRTLGTLSLALALAGSASTALAEATDKIVVRHITVQYGDLNLDTQIAAQSLVNRIATAATEACGGKPSVFIPLNLLSTLQRKFEACRTEAMQAAVTTVNRPIVTAAYDSKHSADNRTANR